MKSAALALWASLIFAGSTAAQSGSSAAASPQFGSSLNVDQILGSSDNSQSPSMDVAQLSRSEAVAPYGEAIAIPIPAEPPSEPTASVHEPVYGVLQDLDFQVYGGFTFFRFYELPGVTGNLAGLNVSLVYYPHAGCLGADGEFTVGFASQNGNTTFEAGMGGGRFRVMTPRHTEVWAHALAGGAHFIPKAPYGSESAFAFEAGGGVDWSPHGDRLAFRVQADLLGTYFFSTHQYGPKLSVGIVYNF